MTKTFMILFLLLGCSLALAVAQPQYQPKNDQDKQTTFTGCLQSGTEPNSYVLNNATPSDMSQQSSNPQNQDQQEQAQNPDLDQGQYREGTEPSELARASEKSFTLIPEGRVNLKNYVGKKVEVTGKMIEPASRATTPSGQSSNSTEMTGQSQFQVSSVRQIANSCQ